MRSHLDVRSLRSRLLCFETASAEAAAVHRAYCMPLQFDCRTTGKRKRERLPAWQLNSNNRQSHNYLLSYGQGTPQQAWGKLWEGTCQQNGQSEKKQQKYMLRKPHALWFILCQALIMGVPIAKWHKWQKGGSSRPRHGDVARARSPSYFSA